MQRSIIITDDGSSSLFVPELGEHYHSHFGAVQESQHIFIDAALAQIKKDEISVLEFGFGTGLNALMTYRYAQQFGKIINYVGLEKYPITEKESSLLNYASREEALFFQRMHLSVWNQKSEIMENFSLLKQEIDFRNFKQSNQLFDVVYFDAFAPDIQPHLWSLSIFQEIYNSMSIGGILTTYTVKGDVRRALKAAGFSVEKIAGPIGKREITRAIK